MRIFDYDFTEIELRMVNQFTITNAIQMEKKNGVWKPKRDPRHTVHDDIHYGGADQPTFLGADYTFAFVDELGSDGTVISSSLTDNAYAARSRVGVVTLTPIRSSAGMVWAAPHERVVRRSRKRRTLRSTSRQSNSRRVL